MTAPALVEFDRYAIERALKAHSNDLLDAAHFGRGDLHNAVARAQSVLADWQYLQTRIDALREQIRDAQRREAAAPRVA